MAWAKHKTFLAMAGLLSVVASGCVSIDREALVAEREARLYRMPESVIAPSADDTSPHVVEAEDAVDSPADEPQAAPVADASGDETAVAKEFSDDAEDEELSTPYAPPLGSGISGEEMLAVYVRIALQNNAGLRAAFERWRAALEEIPQVTALPDPMFTWTRFVEEVQTRTGPQESRFTLSQQFPWFGKLRLQGEAAYEQAESLWWDVEAARLALVAKVKNAYYEYTYLAEAIRLVRENLTLLQHLEPVIQRRVQLGGSQGDLIRLQVEIGKLENELATLTAFRPAISGRLRAAINLNGTEPLPWPIASEPDVVDYEPETLEAYVRSYNPLLKQTDWLIDTAETRAQRARLEQYPDFNIGVNYIKTDPGHLIPPPPDSNMEPMPPRGSGEDPWGFTLGLNLPIWRQKYKAGIREARAMRDEYEHMLRQQQHDLSAQLKMVLYELENAARQMDLYQDTLIPRAQQALEVIEIAYESGNASFLDVIDAQQELLTLDKAYWRAVADYLQALADLEVLCGGVLP